MSEGKNWAIGDIHGCVKTLRALVEEKIQPAKNDKLIFVGDYIDRGPDSKGVVSYVMHLRLMGFNVITLKGNHEDMMLKSVWDRTARNNWFYNGGMATLKSFGVREVKEIPEQFIEFMKTLEYYYLLNGTIVVHAGLNFGVDDPLEDKDSMLWMRNQFYHSERIGNRTMVHGHTPVTVAEIETAIQTKAKVIDIDNGCVYAGTEGLGALCALELDTMQLLVQPNVDIVF